MDIINGYYGRICRGYQTREWNQIDRVGNTLEIQ